MNLIRAVARPASAVICCYISGDEKKMKWKISKAETENKFEPYTITLTITNREEQTHFHDNVMSKLNPEIKSDPFYGAVFQMGEGETPNVTSGEI